MGTRHDLPGSTFGPREQFSWEVVWLRAGVLDLEIDDRRLRLKAGDVAIVPPGAVDRYEWTGERRVVHSFVHFALGPVGKGWPPRERWAGRYALAEPHIVQHALDAVTALPIDRPDLWTVVGAPMLELALRMLLVGPSLPPAPQVGLPACVDRALDWMRARVASEAVERFCLVDVARAARVDRAHLCRAFRSHLDVTPMQCARLMRLDRAVAKLERSDDGIKEIAEATGFANTFHFSRCFSATFRISPTRYREDFHRGVVHRLVTPALERLAAQRIVMNEPALSGRSTAARAAEAPAGVPELDNEAVKAFNPDERPNEEAVMARVTGIGGVFFKSTSDHKRLAAWYRDNLGLVLEDWGGAILRWPEDHAEDRGLTVWHVAERDSKWFSPSTSNFMINYRVDDLTALLAQLARNGVELVKGPDSEENGKFAWIMDPDGNKVELWEPSKKP